MTSSRSWLCISRKKKRSTIPQQELHKPATILLRTSCNLMRAFGLQKVFIHSFFHPPFLSNSLFYSTKSYSLFLCNLSQLPSLHQPPSQPVFSHFFLALSFISCFLYCSLLLLPLLFFHISLSSVITCGFLYSS